MGRRTKPVKIKRYRKSFGGQAGRRQTAKRWTVFLVVLALVFVVGFFAARPLIDAASGLWYSLQNKGADTPASSQTDSQGTASSEPVSSVSEVSEPETSSQQEPSGQLPQDGVWRAVDFASVATPQAAAATAKQLKSEGVTHALITLKDTAGNIYYATAVPQAKERISATSLDAKAVAEAFLNEGIRPCAYLEAFRDAGAAYAMPEMAVSYLDQGMLWLDTSRELGGKPWLNPYNEDACRYVLALAEEVAGLGYPDIVMGSVQFPSGYSLNLCGYGEGASERTKPQVLKNMIARLDTLGEEKGVNLWFAVPGEAASGQRLDSYVENPVSFGAKNLLVTARFSYTEEGTLITDGLDAEALREAARLAKEAGTQLLSLRVQGAAVDDAAAQALYKAAQEAGFTGTF